MKTKDYSISIIRLLAMGMIVACHMMQYRENELAWWFNVGVQIFLCMSGYLYGTRFSDEQNDIQFFKKQGLKICVDYYAVILLFSAVQFLIVSDRISVFAVIKAMLICGTIPGGEHLWFIPYILICYLMVPTLVRYFGAAKKESTVATRFLCLVILSVPLLHVYTSLISAWINCFVFGLFIGFCNKNEYKKTEKVFVSMVYIAFPLMNLLQIYLDYFTDVHFSGTLAGLYEMYCTYAHAALGCGLFFLLKNLFTKANINNTKHHHIHKICNISDKFSFDVYLVHQFFILGPLSMMDLTSSSSVNVLIILLCSGVLSIVIYQISHLIRPKIELAFP